MPEHNPAPQDRLQVERTDDDPAVFVLHGDLDPHTSPYLQGLIDERLDADVSAVTLDMAGVSFVDSAGLRVIADTHRRLSERDGNLVVRQPTAGLEKLLAVTGLSDHVTVEH